MTYLFLLVPSPSKYAIKISHESNDNTPIKKLHVIKPPGL